MWCLYSCTRWPYLLLDVELKSYDVSFFDQCCSHLHISPHLTLVQFVIVTTSYFAALHTSILNFNALNPFFKRYILFYVCKLNFGHQCTLNFLSWVNFEAALNKCKLFYQLLYLITWSIYQSVRNAKLHNMITSEIHESNSNKIRTVYWSC